MATSERKHECTCLLCRPVPGKRPHPVYGYDLDLVAVQRCAKCGDLIGAEPYAEELGMARFGQMRFIHSRCESEKDRRSRMRMEKNWKKRCTVRGVQETDADRESEN